MSSIWLISYLVLWLLVMGLGLVILALAREVEALHTRLDALQKYLSKVDFRSGVGENRPVEYKESASLR